MTEMPKLMSLAASVARHAAARQNVIAANVANADTPGYRAKDMAPFSAAGDGMALRRTHAGHLAGAPRSAQVFEISGAAADPNGNTVTLEDQILRGIDAQRTHNRAVTIYQSTLEILRASLGRK